MLRVLMRADLPTLRRGDAEPLVDQLVDQLRRQIQSGRRRPGERLPTIRAAASGMGVTRATVQEAYRRLAEAGLVLATVGRGTVVRDGVPASGDAVFSPGAQAAFEQERCAPPAPAPPPGVQVEVSFAELLPDIELLPVDEFRGCIERELRQHGADLLVYGHPLGDPALRALLAQRSHDDEDGTADPDEILITSGAQQGIDLVLRTFTSPGDAVAVPVPTYSLLFGLLRAHGLTLVPLQYGADGLDPDELRRVLAQPGMRLLYVMPSFQNPTGRSMDLDQRQALMDVAHDSRVPVLEDEFQHELRFRGAAPPSLRALDDRQLTVTVRTFSKGLFPGVRTGWVRASREVLARMAALKRATDLDTSPLLQAAMVEFTRCGALDRHLTAVRKELEARHATAQRALRDHMPPQTRSSAPDGGFALWVEVLGVDGTRLAELAAARGVLVAPGRTFFPDGAASSGIRLSLSRSPTTDVEHGIRVLGECAHELQRDTRHPQHRIFL